MKLDKKLLLPAVFAAVLTLLLVGEDGLMSLALPFVLAGNGLRALSLSGSLGNLAAIGLYGLLCLSPLLLAGKRQKEDWLLVLCSGTLFFVMYLMINPGQMPRVMRNEVGNLIYASAVYNVLVAWGVIRLLKRSDELGIANIYQALRIFLMICAAELALVGVVGGIGNLWQEIGSIGAKNTAPGLNLMPTYIFAALTAGVDALECILDAWVMVLGSRLLKQLETDPYSQGSAEAGEKLTFWCKRALGIITLSNMALNLGQVFLASGLYSANTTLRIPVFSLALVFCTLALTRLLSQGKQLKDDNDLFV